MNIDFTAQYISMNFMTKDHVSFSIVKENKVFSPI
jgi:hypothetical protein